MKTSVQRASWLLAFLSPASLYFSGCKLDLVWLFLSIELVLLAFPPSKHRFSRIGVPFLLFTVLGLFLYYLVEGIGPTLEQAGRNLMLLAGFIILFALRIFFSVFGQISLICAITFQILVLSLLFSKELFLVYYLPLYFFLAWHFLLHFHLFQQHSKERPSFVFKSKQSYHIGFFSLGTALVICFLSMFFFLMLPRVTPGSLNTSLIFPPMEPSSVEGGPRTDYPGGHGPPVIYPPVIDLGSERSSANVDETVALRLQLINERGHTFRFNQSIYLRGNVFEIYSQNRWVPGESQFRAFRDSEDGRLDRKITIPAQQKANRPVLTQSISLSPHLSKVCFAMADPFQVEWLSTIFNDQGILEFSSEITSSLDYQVKSSLQSVNPRIFSWKPDRATYPHLLQWSESTPEILKKIAQEVTASCSSDEDRIRKIQDYFKKQFLYELAPKPGPKTISEIEYFVTQSRQGNCTHFATAMVLMLRSLKIPSRVVGGYAFGDWHEIGEYYEFLHKHAHAWVEIPFEGEGFVAFDSTPAQLSSQPAEAESSSASVRKPPLSKTIANWTVDYNQKTQQQLWSGISIPLNSLAHQETSTLEKGLLLFALISFIGWILASFEHWPSWTFWKSSWVLRYSKGWTLRPENVRKKEIVATEVICSLYHEYLRIFARYGYRRSPIQTPEEFLSALPPDLQKFLSAPTQLFQKAFYGLQALSVPEVQSCFFRIRKLKQHLIDRKKGNV